MRPARSARSHLGNQVTDCLSVYFKFYELDWVLSFLITLDGRKAYDLGSAQEKVNNGSTFDPWMNLSPVAFLPTTPHLLLALVLIECDTENTRRILKSCVIGLRSGGYSY